MIDWATVCRYCRQGRCEDCQRFGDCDCCQHDERDQE